MESSDDDSFDLLISDFYATNQEQIRRIRTEKNVTSYLKSLGLHFKTDPQKKQYKYQELMLSNSLSLQLNPQQEQIDIEGKENMNKSNLSKIDLPTKVSTSLLIRKPFQFSPQEGRVKLGKLIERKQNRIKMEMDLQSPSKKKLSKFADYQHKFIEKDQEINIQYF